MTGYKSLMTEEDKEFHERELESFLPNRIYDAHCHVWPTATDAEWKEYCTSNSLALTVGHREYQAYMQDLFPNRKVSSLFISRRTDDNDWVSQESQADAATRCLFHITPKDDPEFVREQMKRGGHVGLKCYHTNSDKQPTMEADIPDYLPESLVKVAHEEGWVITLHMVKYRSVADPSNTYWIRRFCTEYPNMKLILAHSARAFQPSHALEGLPQLTGLDNLYFDLSANCESVAHQILMKLMDRKRLLYGSDFFVSHLRGRSVAVADTFLWLYEESPVWEEKHTTIQPVLVGLEHLRSIKWACWALGLTDSHVEDIFWNNSSNLLNIT